MKPWWELYPGRLEYEVEKLEAVGVVVNLNKEVQDNDNLLQLKLSIPATITETLAIDASVTFPDYYPYIPPKVFLPDTDLPHHLNPFTKEICLLGVPGEDWVPTDTLARLLTEQLPEALRAGADEHMDGNWNEVGQAEPYGAYYNSYLRSTPVLVDGAWKLPTHVRGGYVDFKFAGHLPPLDAQERTLGAACTVRTDSQELLVELPQELRDFFAGPVMTGRWTRVDAPIALDDAKLFWEAAAQADSGHTPVLNHAGTKLELRAVVFPEETGLRESGEGWVFVLKVHAGPLLTGPKAKNKKRQNPKPFIARDQYFLLRPARAGRKDFAARLPELSPLASSKVLVIGAGAVGSAVCLQLARAGIQEIMVVDPDTLEPGNLVRHIGTFEQVGMHKAVAVGKALVAANPYIAAKFSEAAIGAPRRAGEPEQSSPLLEAMAAYDLVIDATAELTVRRLVAKLARNCGKSYLFLEATNGAWGGLVGLVKAGGGWCYTCFEHYISDGTIVLPPSSPAPKTQPIGCALPTFTGAGFDLDEVSLHASRTAAAYLCEGNENAYPSLSSDVDVVQLRDEGGNRSLPSWRGYNLNRHEECQDHLG